MATNQELASINKSIDTSVMEGGKEMKASRKNAVITGVLFIIATVAVLPAAALVPVLSGTDYLSRVATATNASQVAGAALLYLVAAFASVGIAVSLYPVLKKWNAGVALGSVVFRTIEAVMYIAAVVSLLSLSTLSQQFANAGTSGTASAADLALYGAIGDMLRSMREHASVVAVFAVSIGASMYYYLFFQSRLIPRWLSGWGIAATVLMLVAWVLALFSDTPVTGHVLLALPLGAQELVLAVWLIVKGFSSSAMSAIASKSASARTKSNELVSVA